MLGVPCERCPGPGGAGLVQLADHCRDKRGAVTENLVIATHWDTWFMLGPRGQSLCMHFSAFCYHATLQALAARTDAFMQKPACTHCRSFFLCQAGGCHAARHSGGRADGARRGGAAVPLARPVRIRRCGAAAQGAQASRKNKNVSTARVESVLGARAALACLFYGFHAPCGRAPCLLQPVPTGVAGFQGLDVDLI